MSYTTAYPRLQASFLKYLGLEYIADQSNEDAQFYSWLDDIFDVCFVEAEGWCSQPLRASVVLYTFSHEQAKKPIENDHRWKFIPYNANTQLTSLQWRENEFAAYSIVSANNYAYSTDSGQNFVIYRNYTAGQFKATLSSGWSDANMPPTILQGITEMAAWIYKHSVEGGNWFGLSSVSTGGAGQNVSSSILSELNWQRYFGKYRIAVV
jgi:hypothetical protein